MDNLLVSALHSAAADSIAQPQIFVIAHASGILTVVADQRLQALAQFRGFKASRRARHRPATCPPRLPATPPTRTATPCPTARRSALYSSPPRSASTARESRSFVGTPRRPSTPPGRARSGTAASLAAPPPLVSCSRPTTQCRRDRPCHTPAPGRTADPSGRGE